MDIARSNLDQARTNLMRKVEDIRELFPELKEHELIEKYITENQTDSYLKVTD